MNERTIRTIWRCIYIAISIQIAQLIPTASALDLKWQHLMEGKTNPHVIGLTIAITYTASQIAAILQDYRNISPEDDTDIPDRPHKEDRTLDEYLNSFFKTDYFSWKHLKDENLEDFVRRTLKADEWIVPETLRVTREIRQTTAKIMLMTTERFLSTLRLLEQQTALKEGFQQDAVDKDRKLADAYNTMGKWETLALLIPGTPNDPIRLGRALGERINLDPLVNLLVPSAQPTERTPTALAEAFNDGFKQLRDDITGITGKIPPTEITNLSDTIKWVGRQVKGISTMSGVTPQAGAPTIDSDHIDTLVDPEYLPKHGGPYDIKDIYDILSTQQRVITNLEKRNAPRTVSCMHPEDLSLVLTSDASQDWPESLQMVRDLLTQPTSATPTDEDRLFSANDVPKLTDDDDYWTFRRGFEMFAKAATVKPTQLPTAMSRIINRFEGKRRAYMMAYDVGGNMKTTWTPTWKAMLKYMDARFLDRDAHLEMFKKWITLRHSDKFWGQEFIAEFDRIRMTLNQIASVQGKTQISDDKSLDRLMDKLPRKVRDTFRYKHPNAEYKLMDSTDDTTLGDVYDQVIEEWKFLHNMNELGSPRNNPKSNAANPQVPVSTTHPENRVNWADLVCDKPCFDTTPAIHGSLRGPWRELKPDQQRGLHAKCRRPLEEHNHMVQGCNRPGPHMHHLTNPPAASRSGQPSGNDPGDE